MAFPDTDLDIIIRAYLGANPNDHPDDWPSPTDLSSRLMRQPIQIFRGRRPGQKTAAAGSCVFWLQNTDGALTPTLATSQFYPHWDLGCPMTVSVDNVGTSPPYRRFGGFIADVTPVMVPGVGGQNISAVQVTLAGVIRRITQGAVAKSALGRTVPSLDVVAEYWPLEGITELPTVVPSGLAGGTDATVRAFSATATTPFDWAADDKLAGSGPLPTMTNSQTSAAGIEARVAVVPDPAFGLAFWTRTYAPGTTTASSNGLFTQTLLTIRVSNSEQYSLVLTAFPPKSSLASTPATGGVIARLSYTVDSVLDDFVDSAEAPFTDAWRFVYVRLSQSGADVSVSMRVDGQVVATGTIETATLARARLFSFVAVSDDAVGDEVITMAVGQPIIMSGSTTDLDSAATQLHEAGLGYAGEQAHERFERICVEEGIVYLGGGTESVAMGPQPIADPMTVLRDCETVDHGMLIEHPFFGLDYRTSRQRENLPPAMTVDLSTYKTTAGTQADVLTPVRNDARIRNEWTVSRANGSSATIKDDEHIARFGRYNDSATVNVETDEQLIDQAGWRVGEGTFEGLRYRDVPIDLGANE